MAEAPSTPPRTIPADHENLEDDKAGAGPGASPAGVGWIIVVATYAVLVSLALLSAIVELWPEPTTALVPPTRADTVRTATSATPTSPPADSLRQDSIRRDSLRQDSIRKDSAAKAGFTRSPLTETVPDTVAAPAAAALPQLWCDTLQQRVWAQELSRSADAGKLAPRCVRLLGSEFPLSHEKRLLLLVLCAGALGGALHVLRSVGWYVGNRRLMMSWLPRYVLLPFTGAIIGVIFYWTLRTGFLSPSTPVSDTNPIGFVVVAAMVGLFSEQAVLKLKELAETLFTRPKAGADPAPRQGPLPGNGTTPGAGGAATPAITTATRTGDVLEIVGTGLVPGTVVHVNGTAKPASTVRRVDDTRLQVTLSPGELSPTELKVIVVTPAGRSPEVVGR